MLVYQHYAGKLALTSQIVKERNGTTAGLGLAYLAGFAPLTFKRTA